MTTRYLKIFLILIASGMFLAGRSSQSWAASNEGTSTEPASVIDRISDVHVSAIPFQYNFVEGDVENFQSHQWMKGDAYMAGLDEFSMKYEVPEQKIKAEATARAIVNNNDYEASFLIEKENVGHIHFEYEEFRKYYDDHGGTYYPFGTFSGRELDRELYLDVGKIDVEVELTPQDLPTVILKYEHEYKTGSKSSLAWADAREQTGGIQRKIAPAWREIVEEVNVFEVRLEDEIFGFETSLDQRIENMNSENQRYEIYLSTTATASDAKYRIQEQQPELESYTTTFETSRWFWDNKAHGSFGYRFNIVDADEVENYFEFNSSGVLTNFAFPEQKRQAKADSSVNSHRWVLAFTGIPKEWLNAGLKVLGEITDKGGDSSYPSDDRPQNVGLPDGSIDHVEQSKTIKRVRKLAESASIRFKKIPRTALYMEGSLMQEIQTFIEDRISYGQVPSAGDNITRDSDVEIMRGQYAIGGNFAPWRFLNFTSQVSYKRDNADWNNNFESVDAVTARTDEISIAVVSANTRVTVKPVHWTEVSFRHMVSDVDFFSRYEREPSGEAGTLMNDYTFDVTVRPNPELIFMGAFTRHTSKTEAPEAMSLIPTFAADYNVWLLNTGYYPNETFHFNSTLSLTRANNYQDFTSYGLPYGSDFDKLGLKVDAEIKVTDRVSVNPYYAFYYYRAGSFSDFGNYNANIAGFEVTTNWG